MAIKYKATNSTNLLSLFVERILYDAIFISPENADQLFVVPGGRQKASGEAIGVKNYWAFENILYGKVNKSLICVAPIKEILKPIDSDGETFYVFSEVAECYSTFRDFFNLRARYGNLAEDNYLQSPKIFKAFEDADINYNVYLTKRVSKFNKNIFLEQQNNKIKNIKDYSKKFINDFMNNKGDNILTRTAYRLSNKVSSISSGLSIEIADLDPSNNADKQLFLDSPNFQFYRQSAINAGFLIDKNIPWKLNFDMSSPTNKDKIRLAGPGIDAATSYLTENFVRVYREDIEYLLSMIVMGYNSLVNDAPFYREGLCVFSREKVDKEKVFEETLKRNYWIKKYILIRNKETGHPYRDTEIDKIIFNAIDLPEGRGIDYIDKKFRLPFIYEGSLTYELFRQNFTQNTKFPLDNFSEYVKIVIQRAINEIY